MKAEMDDGCSEKTETPTSVTDSMQDYLYAIFEIVEEKGSVRAVDIAKRMNFSKPSVHNMIRQLESGEIPEKETYVEEMFFDTDMLTEELILRREY